MQIEHCKAPQLRPDDAIERISLRYMDCFCKEREAAIQIVALKNNSFIKKYTFVSKINNHEHSKIHSITLVRSF